MSLPLSDMYGRAFEFCVATFIFSKLEDLYPHKVRMTGRAKEAQDRGHQQFDELTSEEKTGFEKSGSAIAEWLAENKFRDVEEVVFEKPAAAISDYVAGKTSSKGIVKVTLDRVPDFAGVEGDVTDIRIEFSSSQGVHKVNVSLKHRHEALKHPRLTRVPVWIGMVDSRKTREYELAYEKAWSTFFEKGKALSPSATKFRELKAIKSTFIEDNLYKPLYTLVQEFLQNNIANTSQVQQLFEFLVGKYDFVKFVDHDGKIEVRDFSAIPKPRSVKIEYDGRGYLYLQFDNGWRLAGRLHTATEWLKKSIKFDVQPVNLDSVIPAVCI